MTYMLPPLNALRAFEAAARHLSFKLAAHELHVTPGAVSQQVRALEERLGTRLFERLHKQLVLTPAGRAYLPALRDAFREIAAATTRLRSDGAAVTLNVGVHAAFDFRRLHLDRFRASQPLVGVRISQPAALAELLEGKVDLVIARGVERHPGYRCDRLDAVGGRSGVADYLVCPDGTADCLEVATLRAWLLAPRDAGFGARALDDTDARSLRAGSPVAEMGE